MILTDAERRIHEKLSTSFEFYAPRCLKIKSKAGEIIDFTFNKAQQYIHRCIEDQLLLIGMVRAIIIKGRQQGSSTYVTGRYFWKCTTKRAQTVYILSHEAKSTRALFGKVETYYKKAPAAVRPSAPTSNRTEMKFDNDGEYILGTAGAEDTGRSQTAQLFHASEPAFYSNPDSVRTGALQIVADVPGTEIIFESTANGMNWYYDFVMDALAGKNGYIVIFVPWFWQDEYQSPVPEKFDLTEEEATLKALYKLTNKQLCWRRKKISELKSERLFKQEYPCTIAEAFQSSGSTFYDPDLISKARRTSVEVEPETPLVLGVDPARKGDRTVLCLRRGRKILQFWKYDEMDTMRLAGIIADLVDTKQIDKVFVDYGLGYGTVDRLRELGYGQIVQGVHFGESPSDVQFLNKRAEMAFNFRDWLADGDVSVPDDDDMAVDIAAMPDFKVSSTGKLSFPDKASIKKEYGRSPDILDSIMLTFAYPVRSKEGQNIKRYVANTKKGSQLTTLSRVRASKEKPNMLSWGSYGKE